MTTLNELLDASAALHDHLCPRQVLGVRMGMFAGELLDLELPQADMRLLVVVETDGCGADGIAVATNCWIGRRTMRVEDYGKLAATFVHTAGGGALRIAPRLGLRQRAPLYAPGVDDRRQMQLLAYQRMPANELFSVYAVELRTPVEQIISRPGLRTVCSKCGEEIMNEREITRAGLILCKACAGDGYYRMLPAMIPVERDRVAA